MDWPCLNPRVKGTRRYAGVRLPLSSGNESFDPRQSVEKPVRVQSHMPVVLITSLQTVAHPEPSPTETDLIVGKAVVILV